MRLAELVTAITPEAIAGTVDVEIAAITCDSRHVQAGSLFCALRGSSVDGHLFIPQALAAGAVAFLVEDAAAVPAGVPCITVTDARLAMARLAALFYGEPTAAVPLVGITGTNGKTTTTYLVEGIMEAAGIPTAVLGTISYRFRDRTIPAPHTTPESVDLQRTLRELVMSYFEHYYNLSGERTLRAYSTRPVNLKRFDEIDWMTTDEPLWAIPNHLVEVAHTRLLPRSAERRLTRLDERSIAAGKTGMR